MMWPSQSSYYINVSCLFLEPLLKEVGLLPQANPLLSLCLEGEWVFVKDNSDMLIFSAVCFLES